MRMSKYLQAHFCIVDLSCYSIQVSACFIEIAVVVQEIQSIATDVIKCVGDLRAPLNHATPYPLRTLALHGAVLENMAYRNIWRESLYRRLLLNEKVLAVLTRYVPLVCNL